MEALVVGQQSEIHAEALRAEIEHLSRAENELRRQVEHLESRRKALTQVAWVRRPHASAESDALRASVMRSAEVAGQAFFCAADVEQLEQRRMELEQERFAQLTRNPGTPVA